MFWLISHISQRLWHRCFSVNFTKWLRTPFSQRASGKRLPLFFIYSKCINISQEFKESLYICILIPWKMVIHFLKSFKQVSRTFAMFILVCTWFVGSLLFVFYPFGKTFTSRIFFFEFFQTRSFKEVGSVR